MKRIILLLVGLFCCSCFKDPYHHSEAYFKAQYRDPCIIGKWVQVNRETLEEKESIYVYYASGELRTSYKGFESRRKRFLYKE